MARKVEVWLHGITVLDGVTIPVDRDEHMLERFHENIDLILKDKNRPEEMDGEIIYWDIYNRRCKTRGLKFYLDKDNPKTRYLLDSTQWHFAIEK